MSSTEINYKDYALNGKEWIRPLDFTTNKVYKSHCESHLQAAGTRTVRVKLHTFGGLKYISDLKVKHVIRIINDKDRELPFLCRLLIKRNGQLLDEGLTNGTSFNPPGGDLIDWCWAACSSPSASVVDNVGEYELVSPQCKLWRVDYGDELWTIAVNPNFNAPWLDATQSLNLFAGATWVDWDV